MKSWQHMFQQRDEEIPVSVSLVLQSNNWLYDEFVLWTFLSSFLCKIMATHVPAEMKRLWLMWVTLIKRSWNDSLLERYQQVVCWYQQQILWWFCAHMKHYVRAVSFKSEQPNLANLYIHLDAAGSEAVEYYSLNVDGISYRSYRLPSPHPLPPSPTHPLDSVLGL